MKMCACMIYAGVTNTSCVLEAKCVTGPNACLARGPGEQTPTMRPCLWCLVRCASPSLFLNNRSAPQLPWSLTHTLFVSLSISSPSTSLTVRRILQPCDRNRAAGLSDNPSLRVRHGSRASFYMVLCKVERREHYNDFDGNWYISERHVRNIGSSPRTSKLIRQHVLDQYSTLQLPLQTPFSLVALCRKRLTPHAFDHSFHVTPSSLILTDGISLKS
jgi:hypothetical protein